MIEKDNQINEIENLSKNKEKSLEIKANRKIMNLLLNNLSSMSGFMKN
jgi:hypothetical protein